VRGTLAAPLAVALLLAGTATAAPEPPRAACGKRLVDQPGDAAVNYNSLGTPAVGTGTSLPALDITGVLLRVTADEVQAFVEVGDIPAPAAMGTTDTEYRWNLTFKSGSHTVTFGALMKNPAHASVPGPADSGLYPKASTGPTGNDVLTGATATVDPAGNRVAFTAPRAKFEQNVGEPLAEGDVFDHILATTQQVTSAKISPADTTSATPEQATWTVGDDYCFGPPPASLAGFAAAKVQYGDTGSLRATLTGESGSPLAGRTVRFAVPGEPAVSATTGADGVANAAYVPRVPAGRYAVTVTFDGDATDGKARLTGSVDVVAEATRFNALQVAKPSATARTVTATLVDDDKHPVAGQKVDFYVSGKRVATVATDAAGRAVYKAAKKGQSVQARSVGTAGRYLAAASAPVQVG
jgi:hypothetical protein